MSHLASTCPYFVELYQAEKDSDLVQEDPDYRFAMNIMYLLSSFSVQTGWLVCAICTPTEISRYVAVPGPVHSNCIPRLQVNVIGISKQHRPL